MKPRILIFGQEDKLVKNLRAILLEKRCVVVNQISQAKPDYAILIKDNFEKDYLKFLNYVRDNKIKSVLVLPYVTAESKERTFNENIENYLKENRLKAKTIYLGRGKRAEKKIVRFLFTYTKSGETLNVGRPLGIKIEKKDLRRGRIFKVKKKHLMLGFFLGSTTLLLPVLSFLASAIFLLFSYKLVWSGNVKVARYLFNLGEKASLVSEQSSRLLKYEPITKYSLLLREVLSLARRGTLVYNYSKEVANSLFSEIDYDLKGASDNLFLELDAIYKEASFLQSELEGLPPVLKKILPSQNELSRFRQYIETASLISRKLEFLLGEEKSKTYLVLFQNNMELRPAGGFIGSFAFMTLNKGHLSDTEVFDVYTADGQLKGHVEPPPAIKRYLGEAGWFLRDSNWNPDFPISAERAEWFIDKELDRSVDGVISIDLQVIKSVLKETGGVSIPDYSLKLDDKNFYELIQKEVEENFFPGSRKKADFLTALSRNILKRIEEMAKDNQLSLARIFLDNFNKRHIQTFLHEPEVQKAIFDLGWDGSLEVPKCTKNCFHNFLSLIDANVGVNKGNYSLSRSMKLMTIIKPDGIENHLVVNLISSSEYKSYLRVIVPPKSIFADVEVISGGKTFFVEPEINQVKDRKEAGIYIEIVPKQGKIINFSWEVPNSYNLTNKGEFLLTIRKQAGTINDPIGVNLKFPNGLLTGGKQFSYNTNLDQDFYTKIEW